MKLCRECSWAPEQRYLFGGGGGGINPLMKLCLIGSGVPAFILLDRVSYVLYIK